jgi:DNA-binding PadR family transcriptional regulator
VGETAGHGYELTERLKQCGFELASPGPVYRELRILEEGGLVRSMWSPPQSGPVPRVYELTAAGRQALADVSRELVGMAELLEDFQRRHRQLPPVDTERRPARGRGRRPKVEG